MWFVRNLLAVLVYMLMLAAGLAAVIAYVSFFLWLFPTWGALIAVVVVFALGMALVMGK